MKRAVVVMLALLLCIPVGLQFVGATLKGTSSPYGDQGILADWVIHGTVEINETTVDPVTGEKGRYGVMVNVIVASDGELIIRNATLYFLKDINKKDINMTVQGKLYMYNAKLTVSTNLIDPYPYLDVTIKNAIDVKIVNSTIQFPGNITVIGTNNVLIKGSEFKPLDTLPSSISDPDYFDDGPSVKFVSSTAYIVDTSFYNLFEHEVVSPQYVGTATSTSPTKPITVDSTSDKIISDATTNLPGYETSPIYSLKVKVKMQADSSYDSSSMINLIYGTNKVMLGFVPNYTTQTWVNYTVNIDTLGATVGDLVNGNLYLEAGATTNGTYTVYDIEFDVYVADVYAIYGKDRFHWVADSSTIYGFNVHIDADYTSDADRSHHNAIYIRNGAEVYIANLTVDNTETPVENAQSPPYMVEDTTSKIYIFRYARIRVLDINGNPINGIEVVAESTNATEQSTINTINQNMYNEGLVAGATIRNITSNDYAILPLLTDILSQSSYPNSWYTGNYKFKAIDMGNEIGYANGSFAHFPYLDSIYNYLDVDVETEATIPNLKVMSIEPGGPLVSGRNVTSTVYVYCENANAGDVWVSLKISNGISITEVGNKTITLNVGPPRAVSFTWTVSFPPGNYTMIALAGALNVHESPLTDNELSTSITIYPDVDFAPDPNYFEHSPYPAVGNTIAVTVRIRNYGNENSYAPVHIKITGPGYTAYEDTFYVSVNGGGYNDTTVSFLAQASGTHTVTVDVHNFWDYDQTNNYYEYQFEVLEGSIDYFVENVNISFASDIQSGYVKLNVEVDIGYQGLNPTNVYVAVYDALTQDLLDKRQANLTGGKLTADLYVYVPYAKSYNFLIVADPDNYVNEFNEANNSKNINVNTLTYLSVSVSAPNIVINGTIINITVGVIPYNTDINNLNVSLEFSTGQVYYSGKTSLSQGQTTSIYFNINMTKDFPNIMQEQQSILLSYNITLTTSELSPYIYFLGTRVLTVKERPDLDIVSVKIVENDGKSNDSHMAECYPYSISIYISNKGGTDPTDTIWKETPEYYLISNVTLVIKDVFKGEDEILYTGYVNIPRVGHSVEILLSDKDLPKIKEAGDHKIVVIVDQENILKEKGEDVSGGYDISATNNYFETHLYVNIPKLSASIDTVSAENMEIKGNQRIIPMGNEIVVVIKVYNLNISSTSLYTGKSITSLKVAIYINNRQIDTADAPFNTGQATLRYTPKSDGEMRIDVYYIRGTDRIYLIRHTSPTSVVGVISSPYLIPGLPWLQWWMLVIIIVAVVILVIILAARSIYKKEAENLVECGVCGALIPADATKCPKCGTIFEVGKVKCSSCGTWLDADARQCSLCGAVFVEPSDEEYNKLMEMKKRYDAFLERYKEEARRELGEAFTEEEFYRWWQRHPDFISFEDWKKKEMELGEMTVRCPACGTLNPIDAEVCHVCGASLKRKEERLPPTTPAIPEIPTAEEEKRKPKKKVKKKVIKKVPKK